MKIAFSKYHGAGNDFIIIDNRNEIIELTTTQIELLCNRKFGIGADGLMSLNNSSNSDFYMKYYNSDGLEGTMCGNGGRCIVAFAKQKKIIKSAAFFTAVDGSHKAKINNTEFDETNISLWMNDVDKFEENENSYFINTGSPHHIEFTDKIQELDVYKKGLEIRHSEKYKNIGGTNVNFVEIHDSYLKIRTFERGVENETLACGTGAVAAAIAYFLKSKNKTKKILLKTLGGNLIVEFDNINNNFKNIILSGPTKHVFDGFFEINI